MFIKAGGGGCWLYLLDTGLLALSSRTFLLSFLMIMLFSLFITLIFV